MPHTAPRTVDAQVGNGRTAHYTTGDSGNGNGDGETLCLKPVSRLLTSAQIARMSTCVRCARAAARLAEAPAQATAPAAPAAVLPAPAPRVTVTPPNTHGDTPGGATTTAPRARTNRHSLMYEAVPGQHGGTVTRITVTHPDGTTPTLRVELPYDPERHPGRTLANLGWEVVAVDAYGSDDFFQAWVAPLPPITVDEARNTVAARWPDTRRFQPHRDAEGTFLGYTFEITDAGASSDGRPRYGYVTGTGTYTKSAERHRAGAAALLPAAALDDRRVQDAAREREAAAAEEAGALLAVRVAHSTARAFRPVGDRSRPIGWTFRTGDDTRAVYGWVTSLGALNTGAGTGHRRQAEQEVHAHHQAAPSPAGGNGPVELLRGIAPAEVHKVLPAARVADADPGGWVVEGVVVEHAGIAVGSAPRHAAHPDVVAARAALARVLPATLTDHAELDGSEPWTRGYLIEPRGAGEVRVFWIEAGRFVDRTQGVHGASLDCLAWSLGRAGWRVEPLRRSATCVIAHAPTGVVVPRSEG